MQGSLQTCPPLGYSIDNDDAKYVSGLSTILVATIQEMKDRISQIEYIFCSQLFPQFQSRSKQWKKRFAEDMKAAEDNWKKKECSLLAQIEQLQLEKDQALQEVRHLVDSLEKVKLANDERTKAVEDDWRKKESCILLQMEALRVEKTEALDKNRCLVESLEQEKDKLMKNKRLLDDCDKEKKWFLNKLDHLEKNREVAQLQGQLQQKIEEAADGKRLQEKLLRQIELKDSEVIIERKKRKDLVDSYKKVKSQYNFLVNKLGVNMDGSKREDESNLLSPQQLEARTSHGPKDEDPQTSAQPSKLASKMKEQKDEISLQEKLGDVKMPRLIRNSSSPSNIKPPLIARSYHPQKNPVNMKSEPLVGTKRSLSYWRDTRPRQEPGGHDPHDDFLDTPLENIKGNLSKALKQEDHGLAVPAPSDKRLDSSDDETQDLNQEPVLQKQQISITRPEDKGYKYVEPVRKKADRENLKGFECKQCQKFYDAVLPDGDKNHEANKNTNIRCEHQDGVSRHRYRYLPPLTPEGFWNIGFDSEM